MTATSPLYSPSGTDDPTSSSSIAYTPRSISSDAPPKLPHRGRKGHVKSRNGCRTCKRRKVKCDEIKPECGNCLRFGVPCDFSPITASPRPSTSRRGRPRADWTAWASQLARSPSPSPPPGLDIDTVELLHHYLTSTAMMTGDPSIWRDAAPRLGFAHPCVLHAMLALAAQHLALERTLDAPRYLVLGDRHYGEAVRGATAMLPRIDLENCQALYAATVLVCFTAFARGPRRGDLLVVAEGGVPWFALMRGVRMVLRTVGTEVVLSGVLKPGVEGDAVDATASVVWERFEWELSLGRVQDLVVQEEDAETREMYTTVIESLLGALEAAFGTDDCPRYQAGEFHKVMAWIYRLTDEYVGAVQTREPVALLLLGHFAVLVKTLERYWFIQGWGAHILREVNEVLGPAFEGWLPA